MTRKAQITKTYVDGTFEIDTMSVEQARAHVATRMEAPRYYGLTKVVVNIGRDTHAWVDGLGWRSVRECDNAVTEHPGYPCNHPIATR